MPISVPYSKQNKTGTWVFRRRIPKDLESHYNQSQPFIKKSLGTKDRKEALTRACALSLSLDQDFNRLRTIMDTVPTVSITHEEAENLAKAWYSVSLTEDNISRKEQDWGSGTREGHRLALSGIAEEFKITLHAMNSEGLQAPILNWMESFLSDHGIKVFHGSEAYEILARSFLAEWLKMYEAVSKRDKGETVPTPAMPLVNPPAQQTAPKESASLDDLLENWKDTNTPAHSSYRKAKTALKKLNTFIGSKTPSQITKVDVLEFMKHLKDNNSSPATINADIDLCATVFSTGVYWEKIPNNPFQGIRKPPVPKKPKDENVYTVNELQAIFTSPVFSEGYRPTQGKGEASYWIPLMALFSGARLNELASLYTDDIGTEDNIPFMIYVVEDGDDKIEGDIVRTTKTRGCPEFCVNGG